MKATSFADTQDAVGIMMKVFPADVVGIQVISCSVLHILLLLRWGSCSEALHNTNPLRHDCVNSVYKNYFVLLLTLVVLSVPQEQGMCSTAKEVSAIKQAPQEAGRTGHCAQPIVSQLTRDHRRVYYTKTPNRTGSQTALITTRPLSSPSAGVFLQSVQLKKASLCS